MISFKVSSKSPQPSQWRSRLVAAGMATMLFGCTPVSDPGVSASPPPIQSADQRWDRFVSQFIDQYFAQSPSSAVSAGQHDYDGRIADLSMAGTTRQIAFYKQVQNQALQFDAGPLSRDRQFERELLAWYLGRRLFWLEDADWPRSNPMFHRGAIDPSIYLTRDYAPLSERGLALTRLLESVPRALAQVRAKLHTSIAASFLKRSIGYYAGLARHLRATVPDQFADIGTQGQRAQLLAANEKAAVALDAMAEDLRERMAQADDGFALGSALFAKMLRASEMVDTALAELKMRGQADLTRNLAALARVCTDALQTPDLKACMGLADQQKSLDPVARGNAQLAALKEFVATQNLVTIPSDEEAVVRQSPPYNRANLAYISIPGAFEAKPLPSIYYISPPDPTWTEEVQRAFVPNEGRLLYVSVHEVWPGHFLQRLHRNTAQRPLLRLFSSTTFSEGWAHYTEEMMHDAGLSGDDPLLHIGQIANALKRNVRYLSAIGMHTEGMTPEQSEQLFLEKGLLDLGNARQQAARGTYDPSYLSYTLGKLQIMALRDDWLAQDTSRTLQQFHDQLLSYGGAPVALTRRYMLAGQ